MSISPGVVELLAPIVPCPLAVNSPTADSTAAPEETPVKLNEYVPAKFPVPAPKTDWSCEMISPPAVVEAEFVAGELKSIICARCGEITTMRKKAVADGDPNGQPAPKGMSSQNCIVPRPSGPME